MPETSKNKGGRPPVNATPVTVRLPPDLLARLDASIAQGEKLSRPEAVRQHLQRALPSADVAVRTEESLARWKDRLVSGTPIMTFVAEAPVNLRLENNNVVMRFVWGQIGNFSEAAMADMVLTGPILLGLRNFLNTLQIDVEPGTPSKPS